MQITVIGSGYVGTTAAALFAAAGHNVIALDVDQQKVDIINNGKAPFYETGLNEIIEEVTQSGKLLASTDYKQAITSADIVFSCVGTPDKPDGSSDLKYIYQAAKSAASYLKPGAIYAQKSTVPVGTGREVIKLLPKNTLYVSNPEFLRESTAIRDSLLFDRVVVGSDNQDAATKVLDLHKTVEAHAKQISKLSGINIDKQLASHQGEYVATHLESAELIKVTANAFLALKISFANSIAKLCDKTGADITEVMSVVGADKRIGKAFLNAGRGYGGGCFPKDVSGLISSALSNGIDMPIMTAATDVNESMHGYIINKVEKQVGTLADKNVAVLGLAFKAGTSDTRRSPAIAIANQLCKIGAKVSVYDPEAMDEAKSELVSSVNLCTNLSKALKEAKIIFIATDWQEFSLENITSHASKSATIVDCMNSLNKAEVEQAGYGYIGVGR